MLSGALHRRFSRLMAREIVREMNDGIIRLLRHTMRRKFFWVTASLPSSNAFFNIKFEFRVFFTPSRPREKELFAQHITFQAQEKGIWVETRHTITDRPRECNKKPDVINELLRVKNRVWGERLGSRLHMRFVCWVCESGAGFSVEWKLMVKR